MRRFVLPLLLPVLLAAGCDTAVQPPIPTPPDSLAVYSVVRAGDSSQYAVVTTPRPADQRQYQYVHDATVQMDGHPLSVFPEDSLFDGGYGAFSPPGTHEANYTTDSLYVEPGTTVRLRATHEQHEVTGTVRVPGAFRGTADSMTLHWQRSRGAAMYKVRIERYDDEGEEIWSYDATTTDTALIVDPSEGSGFQSFTPGPHYVGIAAVDSNLAGYRDEEVRQSGVTGGFGFFGAVTRIGGILTLPATDTANARSTARPLRLLRTQNRP